MQTLYSVFLFCGVALFMHELFFALFVVPNQEVDLSAILIENKAELRGFSLNADSFLVSCHVDNFHVSYIVSGL